VYLVDIGNTKAHLYNGSEVVNLDYSELFNLYGDKKLYYINVNRDLSNKLKAIANWINIEPFVKIEGEYSGMGVDRRALLLSKDDGIYIDAGSAITIDKKLNGKFIGGTILPGIYSLINSYSDISKVLNLNSLSDVNLDILPNSSTKETLNYGIIAPIVAFVKSINKESLPIYCCGGDGEILAKYLNAKFDKELIFTGMKKVIKEIKC